MHSDVLSSRFLPKSQEVRLTSILDQAPRFAPWGVSSWLAPKGFSWTTVVHGKIPDTVLVRNSDHAAVLEIPRYTDLIFSSEEALVFICSADVVPTLYIVRVDQIQQNVQPIGLKALVGATYFPAIHRREILDAVPSAPTVIAGYYAFEGTQYIWVINLKNGIFSHEPIAWFNGAKPEWGYESIELIRVDPITNVIVGSGSHIPSFVMDTEGKTLLSFLRRYYGDDVDSATERLIDRWTDRLAKTQEAAYMI